MVPNCGLAHTDGPWPNSSSKVLNMGPTWLWPGYFLTISDEIFFEPKVKFEILGGNFSDHDPTPTPSLAHGFLDGNNLLFFNRQTANLLLIEHVTCKMPLQYLMDWLMAKISYSWHENWPQAVSWSCIQPWS